VLRELQVYRIGLVFSIKLNLKGKKSSNLMWQLITENNTDIDLNGRAFRPYAAITIRLHPFMGSYALSRFNSIEKSVKPCQANLLFFAYDDWAY